MPYCNGCGRYISDGVLCTYCSVKEEPGKIEAVLEDPKEEELVGEVCVPPPEEEPAVLAQTEEEIEVCVPRLRGRRLARRWRGVCKRQLGRAKKCLDTPDSTHLYGGEDIRHHRGMAVLCYLWVLWAVPYLRGGKSPFVKYHLEQGLTLLLLDCLGATFLGVAWVLGSMLFPAAPALAAVGEVTLLVSLLLKIFGCISCLSGKAKELPLLGGIHKG